MWERGSSEDFEWVFRASLDLIVIANPDATFYRVSASSEAILGYLPEEMEGERILGFLHPDDVESTKGAFAALLGGDTVVRFRNRYRHKGGHYRWLSWNAHPPASPDDRMLAVARDITDITDLAHQLEASQEQVRESEAKYGVLFENMTTAFSYQEVICNEAGEPVDYRFLELNPAYTSLTGMTPDQLIGKRAREILPRADRYLIRLYGDVAVTGKPVAFEYYSPAQDRYYDTYCFSPEEGYFAVLFNDCSEKALALKEVRRLNAELESSVHLRTRELEAAVNELKAFSYSVSHDLRAPLRAIDSYAHMLEEDCGDVLGDTGNRYVAKLKAAAGRMEATMEALLALSRLGQRALKLEDLSRADVHSLVTEVLGDLRSLHADRSVGVSVGELAACRADRSLLRQVFANLLGNAFKYTQGVNKAHVDVRAEPGKSGSVFVVTDNGVGFDMRHADKLFGAFQRLHSDERFMGAGVGLATVKRIVERHHGRIWAKSSPGQGASFHFTLS